MRILTDAGLSKAFQAVKSWAEGAFAALSHSHGTATSGAAGFMSAEDKAKLDGIEAGATAGGGSDGGAEAATAAPAMDGTATVGSSEKYAREDHVHPTDTTRAPLASPAFAVYVSGDGWRYALLQGSGNANFSTGAAVAKAIAGYWEYWNSHYGNMTLTSDNGTIVYNYGTLTPNGDGSYSGSGLNPHAGSVLLQFGNNANDGVESYIYSGYFWYRLGGLSGSSGSSGSDTPAFTAYASGSHTVPASGHLHFTFEGSHADFAFIQISIGLIDDETFEYTDLSQSLEVYPDYIPDVGVAAIVVNTTESAVTFNNLYIAAIELSGSPEDLRPYSQGGE